MAATTTVRIDRRTHRTLQSLARNAGVPMPKVLARLVESEERRRLFEEADAAYAALQADPAAWEQELAERRLWENTLGDGLDREDWTTEAST